MKLTIFRTLVIFCVFNIILFFTVLQESLIGSSYFLQSETGVTEEDEKIMYNGLDQLKDEWTNFPQFEEIVENLYSLSAFYDERSERLKILGIAALEKFPNVTCAYFPADTYHDPGLVEVVPGNVKYLHFDQQMKNGTFFPIWIECPIEKRTHLKFKAALLRVQVMVDSVSEAYDDAYNITGGGLLIENSPETSTYYKYKMAMCVQPLVNYEDPIPLAEWIEFHKLLGVEHFTFYNMSIGPKTSALLHSYESSQIKIFPWTLPFDQTKKPIHYHGQILQINDCLYRYKGVAKFVAFVDVDEFIIPGVKYFSNFTTYDEFFQSLFTKSGSHQVVAGVRFSARFSFNNFPRRSLSDPLANNLRILTRPNLSSSWAFVYKSKVVLRPELVQEEEVHWPTLLVNGTKVVLPNEDEVYFIHYRVCNARYLKFYCVVKKESCTSCDELRYNDEGSIVGDRFGNDLLQNVKNRLEVSQF